jgi:hypothetical protein
MAKKGFRYNQLEFRLILDAMFGMRPSEMKELLDPRENPDITMIEIAAARQVVAAGGGDIKAFDFVLDRSIGKVKDKLEVQGPKPTIIKRKDGSAVELGAALQLEEENNA